MPRWGSDVTNAAVSPSIAASHVYNEIYAAVFLMLWAYISAGGPV